MAQQVKYLPLAQAMISGSWDQVPRWALCSGESASPSPFTSALAPSLSLSLSNKQNLKEKKKKLEGSKWFPKQVQQSQCIETCVFCFERPLVPHTEPVGDYFSYC